MATDYPRLQATLYDEVRETLARRAVIDEETSLDLVQGLLVHITWSQYHTIPRSQNAYRLISLAISMLVDLGLNYSHDPEASRASLGCYYLSSCISTFLQKPNILPLAEHVSGAANALSLAQEYDTDVLLPLLIHYQCVFEEIKEAYRIRPAASELHLHAKRLSMLLEQWRAALPESLRHTYQFESRYQAARIRIYEMGLLYHMLPPKLVVVLDCLVTPQAVITNLVNCIAAIKKQLDAFLTLDPATYATIPFEEWTRIMTAFFILYKLSIGPREVPDFDVELCRSSIDLEAYLVAVDNAVRPIVRIAEEQTLDRDSVYRVFPDVLDSARSNYTLARDRPGHRDPDSKAHMDVTKDMRKLVIKADRPLPQPAKKSGCPATGMWAGQAWMFDHESDWHGVYVRGVTDSA